MYNLVSAGFPGERFPTLEHRLPDADLTRPRKPLHAHVCNAHHGWKESEPQTNRQAEERMAHGHILLLECMSK